MPIEPDKNLLNRLSTGVGIVRYPDNVIEWVNKHLITMYGARTAEDLMKHHTIEFYANPKAKEQGHRLIERILLQGHGAVREMPFRRIDGRLIYVDMSGEKLPTPDTQDDGSGRILWTLIDVTQRHRLNSRLSRQALLDPLTNLANRRAFDEAFDRALQRTKRQHRMLSIVILDLDGFKLVNDKFGHEAGDHVLKTVSQRLLANIRQTDFVARLGGDEFVMLIDDGQNREATTTLMEKLDQAVREPILLPNGTPIQIGVSMGIRVHDSAENSAPGILLRHADQALYTNKTHKTDRAQAWAFYNEAVPHHRNPFQQLLHQGALVVHYQPILDNRQRKIVGIEALARLQDSAGKLWMPGEFLPQLQTSDLFELSKQVMYQALHDLSELDDMGWQLWVSINIDPRAVSENCSACIHGLIEQFHIAPERICVEILETGEFKERHTGLSRLMELKELGVQLALDDVGSAYSSLLRIKEMPIDKIKLDQDFVRFLEQNPQDIHFIESVLDLAINKKMDLVVEGVETGRILDAVSVLGVNLIQGYAVARPLPLAQLREFLMREPDIKHRQHPITLFGLYAKQTHFHHLLRAVLLQNPRLLTAEHLRNTHLCPIHNDLTRLQFHDGHPLHILHENYHRAMAQTVTDLADGTNIFDTSHIDAINAQMEEALLQVMRQ